MSRPRSKLDKDQKAKVVEALTSGASLALAAKAVGISRRSLERARKADPLFNTQCEDAAALADAVVQSKLYAAATSGNVTAMIFWLKCRQPDQWKDTRYLVTDPPPDTGTGMESYEAWQAAGKGLALVKPIKKEEPA